MDEKIGSYKIVRKLGEGGMGVVFEGVHVQTWRRVAIKVLHKEASQNTDLLARFHNEARAANLASHPSIIDVYEIGQLPDGRAYITMQYLDGESLGDRLQNIGGPMAYLSAIRVTRQVASGMEAAHAKGIIHRDLKPNNIMLVADPETPGGERAKILDFGIAKLMTPPEEVPGPQPKTKVGMVMGTPAYMSPEQCRGAEQVTQKSDVYSLGVILYRLLSGRTPFIAAGTGEMMAKQLFEVPPPLSTLEPNLPASLIQLVHNMLAKEESARPSMREVAAQLTQLGTAGSDEHRAIQEETVRGGSGPTMAMQRKPPKGSQVQTSWRRRVGIVLGVSLLTSTSIGVGAWRLQRQRPQVQAADSVKRVVPAEALVREAAPPPVMTTIHWSLTSSPSGAQVIRASDQSLLGTTPWAHEQRTQEGQETLILRLSGYADQHATLALGRDESRQTALVALPQDPQPQPSPKPLRPRPSPTKPKPKPKREADQNKPPQREITDESIRVIK